MSAAFRELLKKVGSGTHTSKVLNRAEAAAATRMMLTQEATPAQIGAFMIAHRIRRPQAIELAGMLDAYGELGPQLPALPSAAAQGGPAVSPLLVLGSPFDGRSRTAPVAPLVALILAAHHSPVLMHGGRTMPTKYGVCLADLWQQLGVDWTALSLTLLHQILAENRLGLVYQPSQFPQAEALVTYREELGKRPPLATLELVWNTYQGPSRLAVGYVHPPTEERLVQTLALRGDEDFLMVKGLEGSCELPRDRTAIISVHRQGQQERLLLHPKDYGYGGSEVVYVDLPGWGETARACLAGDASPLTPAVVWNAGFYLWQMAVATDLIAGLALAEASLRQGKAAAQLAQLKRGLAAGAAMAGGAMDRRA